MVSEYNRAAQLGPSDEAREDVMRVQEVVALATQAIPEAGEAPEIGQLVASAVDKQYVYFDPQPS